jgi:hypothetical protein
MPTTKAATKIAALNSPEAMDTRAGPGQKPARPQPAPNTLPSTSRRSICVAEEAGDALFRQREGKETHRDRARHHESQ